MTQYVAVSGTDTPAARTGVIKLHDQAAFAGMRAAGRLTAEILDALVPHVSPGVTTQEIDDLVLAHMVRAGRAACDARVSRVHEVELHLDQPRRLPRHSFEQAVEGRRYR
jgi:hypothetical protein